MPAPFLAFTLAFLWFVRVGGVAPRAGQTSSRVEVIEGVQTMHSLHKHVASIPTHQPACDATLSARSPSHINTRSVDKILHEGRAGYLSVRRRWWGQKEERAGGTTKKKLHKIFVLILSSLFCPLPQRTCTYFFVLVFSFEDAMKSLGVLDEEEEEEVVGPSGLTPSVIVFPFPLTGPNALLQRITQLALIPTRLPITTAGVHKDKKKNIPEIVSESDRASQ